MDADGEVKRFVYDGWDIRICLDVSTEDGQTSAHADLSLGGEQKCRISLAGHATDDVGACEMLEHKARAWVDDWKSRAHSGRTHLAEL